MEPTPSQPVAETPDFAIQIEALKAKNAELIGERRKDKEAREQLQSQLEEIHVAQEQAKTQKLAETGEYKTLWEEAQKTVAELKQQLSEKESTIEEIRSGFTNAQIKSAAIAQLSSAGAVAPEQLYRLLQENLRTKDGQPVAVAGGVEVPVSEYIANLKNPGSGYEHHFSATNRSGMGGAGSARHSAVPGQNNPWTKDSWNVTQQMILIGKDPDMARLLKAEAGA